MDFNVFFLRLSEIYSNANVFFFFKRDIKCIGRGINMKKYMLRLFDDVLEKIKI